MVKYWCKCRLSFRANALKRCIQPDFFLDVSPLLFSEFVSFLLGEHFMNVACYDRFPGRKETRRRKIEKQEKPFDNSQRIDSWNVVVNKSIMDQNKTFFFFS